MKFVFKTMAPMLVGAILAGCASSISVIRFEADRLSGGEHMAYSDFEILYE